MSDLLLYAAANMLFIALAAPLFSGIIKKVKAAAQKRRGPPLLQQYYNLAKLLKKERVYSTNSSQIMKMTPYVNLAALAMAAICVPVVFIPESGLGLGNVILFIYLLALARFFMSLSGLDCASTFGGMGSSREMSIASIIEPITLIVFAALAFTLHTTDFYEMFELTAHTTLFAAPELLLISIPLFIAIITETARVPVDNPETHLELTMVHEGMVLEYSGRDLALMEFSHAVKQALLMAVLINIILPEGIAFGTGPTQLAASMAAFLLKGSVLAVIIGLFESSTAKMRLFALPNLFMTAFFFSALTVLLEVFA